MNHDKKTDTHLILLAETLKGIIRELRELILSVEKIIEDIDVIVSRIIDG